MAEGPLLPMDDVAEGPLFPVDSVVGGLSFLWKKLCAARTWTHPTELCAWSVSQACFPGLCVTCLPPEVSSAPGLESTTWNIIFKENCPVPSFRNCSSVSRLEMGRDGQQGVLSGL